MSFAKRVAGGKDRFKWDEVKVDKDRENYLGTSKKTFHRNFTHQQKKLSISPTFNLFFVLSIKCRPLIDGTCWPLAKGQRFAMV